MAAKKLVYFDRFIAPVGELELQNHSDVVELVKLSSQDPRERLWEAMADAHGLHVQGRSMPPNTQELIDKSPNLLAIVSGLAGYDTIDIPACTEAGVLVCNQTGMGNEPVAEQVTGAMLLLSHRALLADRQLHARIQRKPGELTGNDLLEKTVGIVGFGAIGSRVGEILSAAFRMRVLVHDPIMGDEEIARRGGESVELDELLKESDYVTLPHAANGPDQGHDRRAGVPADEAHGILREQRARRAVRRGGAGAHAQGGRHRRRSAGRLGD